MSSSHAGPAAAPSVETITIGGGCFWCVEAVFDELEGVVSVESGYAGGQLANPTYKQVTSGTTGHAEVTQIVFDPKKLALADLLRVFFTVHDPTTPNRQGYDSGPQYRSIVLYRSAEQEKVTKEIVREFETKKIWDHPIVTEIVPFTAFWKAEDYHQEYFAQNPTQPYCRAVIEPKVAKFRKLFHDRLKKKGS